MKARTRSNYNFQWHSLRDLFLPARVHILNAPQPPKQNHHLSSTCSYKWASREQFTFKLKGSQLGKWHIWFLADKFLLNKLDRTTNTGEVAHQRKAQTRTKNLKNFIEIIKLGSCALSNTKYYFMNISSLTNLTLQSKNQIGNFKYSFCIF